MAEQDDVKISLATPNLTAELLAQLHEAVPQVFSEGKVDFDKLKAALGGQVEQGAERYGLSWAGKAEAFRNVQISSVGTLRPMVDESVHWDDTENLIIEGDNLEVLKLLQKPYHGKVKMIYIDPPYNTGNEFIYPDNYREGLQDYLRYSGQVDDAGVKQSTNTETGGRYHSNWLNMMYPRLFLARNLLREDGVIFVSIDDNEVHNLRMLMNEVFGEENFIACFIWEKRTNRENRKVVSSRHDYVMCFSRDSTRKEKVLNLLPMSTEALSRYKNPDNDLRGLWKSDPAHAQAGHGTKSQFYVLRSPNGNEHHLPSGRCWVYTKEVMEEAIRDGRIWFGQGGNGVPRVKTYLDGKDRGLTPETIWFASETSTNENAKTDLKELFDGEAAFDTPKPVELLQLTLKLCASEGIILDFFAGAGVTAQAVLEQNKEDNGNRKFILIQLPEKTENTKYPTIAHITRERVRRVIAKLNKEDEGKLDFQGKQDRGFRAFKLDSSNFKIWDAAQAPTTPDALAEQLKLYVDNVDRLRDQQDILFELIIKSGLPLSSRIDGIDMDTATVWSVNGGQLLICLDRPITQEVLRGMIALKPERMLCLDVAFEGQDKLKTNIVLEAQSHGVVFKTV